MRGCRFLLLLGLLLIPATPAAAAGLQGGLDTVGAIEAIEIETPNSWLTSYLEKLFREDLDALQGRTYDAVAADQLAQRIGKHANGVSYTTDVRIVAGTVSGRVQVILLVTFYSIESASIEGPAQTDVSSTLRAEVRNLTGKRSDHAGIDLLKERLEAELLRRYTVDLRIDQGSTRQQARIAFVTHSVPQLPFRATDLIMNYRSKQGHSLVLPMVIGCGASIEKKVRSATEASTACAADDTGLASFHLTYNRDGLIERYFGGSLALESVRLGTNRLGARLEYSRYGVTWAEETLTSDASRPGATSLYRRRQTIEPSLAIAFTHTVYATAGFRWTGLEVRSPTGESRSASSALGSIRYRSATDVRGTLGELIPTVSAGYELHAATPGGGFRFTRQAVDVRYTRGTRGSAVTFAMKAGRISGNAPLFERFALGNTETLRGWRKFDIAPLGASRVVHGSLELSSFFDRDASFTMHVFSDVGAAWDAGEPVRVRGSVGVGYGLGNIGFFQVAIPIGHTRPQGTNFGGLRGFSHPMVTLGIRASAATYLTKWNS